MRAFICMAVFLAGTLVFTAMGIAQSAPTPFADFETDEGGWYAEEHAFDLQWENTDTAGPSSKGAIKAGIDPTLPSDSSPESKVTGRLPDGINMADYQYVSFYYKCDSAKYTGGTMYVMPMTEGSGSGAGSSHAGTMIGDGKWHYEEYQIGEFGKWWGAWAWQDTVLLAIGVWKTVENGPCTMWYDQVMLFNKPGDGIMLSTSGAPQVVRTVPNSGVTLDTFDSVTLLFDQQVQGVKAADLLVNGKAATEVTSDDNRRFIFKGFPTPSFPEFTKPGVGTVKVELQPGSIKTAKGDAFQGYSYSFGVNVFIALTKVAFADFETDSSGWYTEEHATNLTWVTDETAGPASKGAIKVSIDTTLPTDSSPESKTDGKLPAGISMAGFQYISFYYKCDSAAYDGDTMYVMPMTKDNASGSGASHSATMLGDGKWHYEEYNKSEFANWWGTWRWEDTTIVVLGVWETADRGNCNVWYDHVMLFNHPGEGILEPVADISNWAVY